MTTESGSPDLWIADDGVDEGQVSEVGRTAGASTATTPSTATVPSTATAPTGSAGGTSVVAAAERADFESRWAQIQTRFVDDPADAVDQARGLATEVARTVTRGIADRLAALDQHAPGNATQESGTPTAADAAPIPSRGEGGETEQLRKSLRDYRDIVQHLLAV